MNGLTVSDIDNPVILRQKGIKALAEALRPIGLARFFQQYGLGAGDYTAERETLEEPQKSKRLDFMRDQCVFPDDVKAVGREEITAMFEGQV
jgi:hypothetical protein